MAKATKIAWARSTFNPWIGCTKIGPGCDNCYADALDEKRFSKILGGGTTDKPIRHFGVGAPRYRTKALGARAMAWDKACAMERETGKVRVQDSKTWLRPGFWPVFPSLCDPFDNEVDPMWRSDFLSLVSETPCLTWLLLTKRIGNVEKMLPVWWDDPEAWAPIEPRSNVWLGVSIVNQKEADRDIPKLLTVPAAKRFVSYEPALGPVDFTAWLYPNRSRLEGDSGPHQVTGQPVLDQIIVGGESSQGGAKARPFDIEWARSTVRQCKAAGVAVFVKQAGSFVIDRNDAGFEGDGDDLWPAGTADKLVWEPFGYVDNAQGSPVRIKLRDRAGADPAEWPEDLRVQEWPR